jgi:hypothetical protein
MTGKDALPTPSSRSRPPALTKWERWLLAGLLVFTLVVRGAVLWGMRGNLEQDPDAYREIAENLLVHGEFALGEPGAGGGDWQPRPTAYRPPLYPILLSNLPAADGVHVSLGKVAVLHLGLGVGTVWLVWATMRRVICRVGPETCRVGPESAARAGPPLLSTNGGPALAGASWSHPTEKVHCAALMHPTIAGLIVACDPILLNQQTLVMTETLAAFLAILSLWCLARFDGARTPFNAAMAGGAIGLAVLCRPTFLPWLVLVGLGMMVVRSRNSECRMQNAELGWLSEIGVRVANFAVLLFVVAMVVSPWGIRNYRVFGKPIMTTTHGGYTLLLGNNGSFYQWLQSGNRDVPWNDLAGALLISPHPSTVLAVPPPPGEGTEMDTDTHYYKDAKEWIRSDPKNFVRACFYRVGQLWSPLPNRLKADESLGRRLLRYGTCGWYCGVYLLAVVGVWRLRWRLLQSPWVWGVLMCVVFTGVHTFYWSNLRMRAPLMPFVAMVAAAALKTERRREGETERK